MNFTTLKFIVFFAVVVVAYYLLPKKLQKYLLLASSYVFYISASGKLALLLLGDTLISYACARATQGEWLGRRKLWTVIGAAGVLGTLFLFKYFDFFCGSFLPLLGVSYEGLRLILPIGISFFSFSVSAYLFDVCAGKMEAERNFLDYACFVSFFPVLLAGPIGRAQDFLPQLKTPVVFKTENVKRGALRFVWGAFKKMVLADTLALIVNAAYTDPSAVSGGALIVAVLLYSLQLYFDFAAYSDMAIGAAAVLGLRVRENFAAPYFSRSVRTFWRKWHMSLISWLRDYIYFPLGGSRKGIVRTRINVLLVFAFSGLWHGAEWSFIVWGLLNGLYQVVGTVTAPVRERLRGRLHISENSYALAVVQAVVTFLLLSFARIFFRSDNIPEAIYVIKRMLLIFRDGFGLSSVAALLPARRVVLIVLSLIPCAIEDVRIAKGKRLADLSHSFWRFWIAMLVLTLLIAVFGVYGPGIDMRQFVYFQF